VSFGEHRSVQDYLCSWSVLLLPEFHRCIFPPLMRSLWILDLCNIRSTCLHFWVLTGHWWLFQSGQCRTWTFWMPVRWHFNVTHYSAVWHDLAGFHSFLLRTITNTCIHLGISPFEALFESCLNQWCRLIKDTLTYRKALTSIISYYRAGKCFFLGRGGGGLRTAQMIWKKKGNQIDIV
jgi:hypothetical protein